MKIEQANRAAKMRSATLPMDSETAIGTNKSIKSRAAIKILAMTSITFLERILMPGLREIDFRNRT